jgi:hypothetical protein
MHEVYLKPQALQRPPDGNTSRFGAYGPSYVQFTEVEVAYMLLLGHELSHFFVRINYIGTSWTNAVNNHLARGDRGAISPMHNVLPIHAIRKIPGRLLRRFSP